jgi:hypothetical protein
MITRTVILLLLCIPTIATLRAEASPTPIPPYHRITLATLADTGEQIAILDQKAFRSVELLKDYISTLPLDTRLYFATWDHPPGDRQNKFVLAAQDLKAFCEQHKRSMTLKTIAPYF